MPQVSLPDRSWDDTRDSAGQVIRAQLADTLSTALGAISKESKECDHSSDQGRGWGGCRIPSQSRGQERRMLGKAEIIIPR